MWAELVRECDALGAVAWEWQAADGVMGKSRLRWQRPDPTDRAPGRLVEQHGGAGACRSSNVIDQFSSGDDRAIVVEPPEGGPALLEVLDKTV